MTTIPEPPVAAGAAVAASSPKRQYKHIVYNPLIVGINKVIADLNDRSWRLHSLVPVTSYEVVAVFARKSAPERIDC